MQDIKHGNELFSKLLLTLLVGLTTLFLSGQSIPYGESTDAESFRYAEIKQKVDSLNALSDISIDSSYSAAYSYSLQALRLSESIHYDSGKIITLISLGRYFAVSRKYVTAFELFFQALSLSTSTNNINGKVFVNFRIGQTFNTLKNPEKAIEYISKSLDLSNKLHDTVYIIENLSVLGFAHNSLRDNTGDKYFFLALGLAEKIKDSARIRTAYRNLGILYNSRNEHYQALYFYQKALAIMPIVTPNYDKGALYSLVAHEWQILKQFDKCLYNHHLARAIRLKQNRTPMYISSMLNIGNLYLDWGKYDSSLYYLQGGLSMLKNNEYYFLQQYGYQQLFKLYEKLGDSKKALDAFQKYTLATENLLKESNQAEMSYFESNYVLSELENQNRELQNALEIQKFRTRSQLFLSLLYLSILLLFVGTFFYFYSSYRKNKKSRLHLEEINAKLDQEIKERVRYEDALAENARQKELLLREIHHRVKNNFAILISLMTLQKISSDSDDLNNLIDELQIRVRTMSLVHELLYRSESLDIIPFASYLDQLLNIVAGTYASQKIKMYKDIDDCTLNISTALPLGLIVNELLTNSFKYAFPGNPCGELHISLKPIETDLLRTGNWRLTIHDNGPGLPEGFDLEASGSLGSQIVRLLIEQIEGEIFITNENGACFTILFNDKMS